MYEELKEMARNLPGTPGVYLMKDEKGDIIYIGKAINVKKRVSSYFTGSRDTKTRVLVNRIEQIEHISTRNEYEALLLENTLIKKWKPRYNINLKDGKTYPVIRITNEDFPRIFRTRRIIDDGSSYFGPYPSVTVLDIYLELIEKIFPLRKCRGPLKKRDHPCLYYHIGRCCAPCSGKISKEKYAARVEEVRNLLSGETGTLITRLKAKMEKEAADLNFEKAADLRDSIQSIEEVGIEQEVVDFNPDVRDYIAWTEKEDLISFNVFQMRGGKLTGRDLFQGEIHTTEEEVVQQFFLQYYTDPKTFPTEIYLCAPINTELIDTFFKEEHDAQVTISAPKSGRHYSIIRMALENSIQDVERRIRARANIPGLEELRKVLQLKKLPRRIEGFDIAQLSGKHPVSSMVSFYNGNPDKKNYRQFHIKSLGGKIDDYEAMREVIARRYTRVINEGLAKPDLVLVDGGKGQVSVAREILDALGLTDMPLIGLAKKNEEIFLPAISEPVTLPDDSEALRVLQYVRDESHRFATSFNKRLRKKGTLSFSRLEEIQGIGPGRSKKILEAFGSIKGILDADTDAVAKAGGISLRLAAEVKKSLGKKNVNPGGEEG